MSVDDKKIIYSMMKVSKNYDKKPVIKDISLSYFYGAKIGVIGPNGAGKSTLIRIMAGVESEFGGEARLVAQDERHELLGLELRVLVRQELGPELLLVDVARDAGLVAMSGPGCDASDGVEECVPSPHAANRRESPP